MKTIWLVTAIAAMAMLWVACAPLPVASNSGSRSGSYDSAGIDSITQASIDESARQTQEDAQRMSDWITQQQNQQMMDQINQMNVQASIDASNAAAAAAQQAADIQAAANIANQ